MDGELGRLLPNDGLSLRLGGLEWLDRSSLERLGGLERLDRSSLELELERFDLLGLPDLLGLELAPSERLGADASLPARDPPSDLEPRVFG